MGCISSKVISRSISFRDELNKRQQILGSRKGGDQFLTLMCTSGKLQDGSTNLDPKAASLSNLSPRKDIDETPMAEEILSSAAVRLSHGDLKLDRLDPPKRSKSWHQLPYRETSSPPESKSPDNKELEWKNTGIQRSRSFHTVEEFDALLERIRLTSNLNIKHEDCLASVSKETDVTEISNEASSGSIDILNARKNAAREKHEGKNGTKRRSLARGLESLNIPTPIELQAVGSLREWLQGGREVDSPGTYVTPKFGSYTTSRSKAKNEPTNNSNGCIFNPEIMTAIEEHMQQLQVEEETILKQIEEHWEDRGMEKDQANEEHNIQVEKRGVD